MSDSVKPKPMTREEFHKVMRQTNSFIKAAAERVKMADGTLGKKFISNEWIDEQYEAYLSELGLPQHEVNKLLGIEPSQISAE